MSIWAVGVRAAGQTALQSVASLIGSPAPERSESSSDAAAIEDELILSTEAESAKQPGLGPDLVARLFPGVPRSADGSIHLEDIRTYRNERRDALNARIREAFRDAGLDTNEEIRLQVGYDGRIVVANDHPQREEIEQIFADDAELRNHFAEVASLSELIRAGDEATRFQRAYAKDPVAAVAEFWHLFSGQARPEFSLLICGDESSIEFQ